MSEVIHFRCDRCGAVTQDPAQMTRIVVRPSETFSLDQEEIDLCLDCEKAAVAWLNQKPEKTK